MAATEEIIRNKLHKLAKERMKTTQYFQMRAGENYSLCTTEFLLTAIGYECFSIQQAKDCPTINYRKLVDLDDTKKSFQAVRTFDAQ